MKWQKERLEKIPVGTSMLVDREFLLCAPFYPNLIAQLTPYFLDGRDQFCTNDISQDRKKCKARYTSDTSVSQVTDQTYLCDQIPRSHF